MSKPRYLAGNGKVATAFCFGGMSQTPQWRAAYTRVLLRDAGTKRRIVGEFAHEVSGVHIPTARCDNVRKFLAHPAKPEWLWMVDTDATFADDVLERLIASAHPTDRPIVGALAFGVSIAQTADGVPMINEVGALVPELRPTIYTYNPDGSTTVILNYPRDQLVQCHATGAHCLLVHRNVLEDERWTADGHPLPWFRTAVMNGDEVSEDHFFCLTAGTFGYPVWVDTAIKTGHVKTWIADETWFNTLRSIADGSH